MWGFARSRDRWPQAFSMSRLSGNRASRYHRRAILSEAISARARLTSLDLTPLGDTRRPIMVVSHERSGTHFMMNTLAACFDYVSKPWLDIDRHRFNINYYHAQSLQTVVQKVAAMKTANLMKSHHEYAFFAPIVASFHGALDIVYIYRNPADAMASFWRFLPTWHWTEGPKAETALAFANAAPMGQLMRFQFRQYGSMLDRWANHVLSWTRAAQTARHIHLVKYEDLAERYEDTVSRLGTALGIAPRRLARPARDENVVQRGAIDFTPPPTADNRDKVAELARAKYSDLMARLGYDA